MVIFGIGYYSGNLIEKDVVFSSTFANTKIKIDSKDDHENTLTIDNDTSAKLRVGDYNASYLNSELNQDGFTISITKDTNKISLDPFYGNNQLQLILDKDGTAIEQTINSLFKSKNYLISDERLYHQGEWFSCSLVVYQINPFGGSDLSDPDNYDNYYVILKKDTSDNKWKLAGGPSLALTKPSNPLIPQYILDNLNPTK